MRVSGTDAIWRKVSMAVKMPPDGNVTLIFKNQCGYDHKWSKQMNAVDDLILTDGQCYGELQQISEINKFI